MLDRYQVAEARALGRRLHPDHHGRRRRRDGRHARAPTPGPGAWTPSPRCTTRPSSTARCVLDCRLIGINNRDLRTFDTTLETTERLAPRVPQRPHRHRRERHRHPRRPERLAKVGVRAFLVGESLMRQPDVTAATRALLGGGGVMRSRLADRRLRESPSPLRGGARGGGDSRRSVLLRSPPPLTPSPHQGGGGARVGAEATP